MTDPIVVLADAVQQEQPAVLATVVEITGASPAKAGSVAAGLTAAVFLLHGQLTPVEQPHNVIAAKPRIVACTTCSCMAYAPCLRDFAREKREARDILAATWRLTRPWDRAC